VQSTNRGVHNQSNANRSRQMIDDVALVNQVSKHARVHDGIDDTPESPLTLQVLDVHDGSGRKIVQNSHIVSLSKQRLSQMRTDKSSAACNKNVH
jgi:hypothetical protein